MEVAGRQSPPSSVGEPDLDPVTDPLFWQMLQANTDPNEALKDAIKKGNWCSVTDNSDAASLASSLSSSDGSFLNAEADFASAVAKAAELSGLTVVGSTVIDPNAGKERQKIRKPAKHRERAKRPTSPYSTDSNYSTVQAPPRPYPKSERKKTVERKRKRTPETKSIYWK